jgi:hypothetical protein
VAPNRSRSPARIWSMGDVPQGDIVIPLRDGDVVSLILGMAVAIRGVADKMDELPRSSGLHICYREYASRCEGFNEPWSSPRI